jgi:hypothetical protein
MIICLVAVSLFVVSSAFAEVNWSGDVETNTDFVSTSNGTDTTEFAQGGRVKLTAESKMESDTGFFVAGKGQVELKLDGSAATADSWVQIGTSGFALKVGRFEGEGCFSKGEDVFIVGAAGGGDRYELKGIRGRSPNQLALDFSAGESMAIQIGAVYGNGDYLGIDGVNVIGARPVVTFSTEAFTLKAGAEFAKAMPQDNDAEEEATLLGFAGDAKVSMGSMTAGASVARESIKAKDATGADLDDTARLTAWGYLTMAFGEGSNIGFGAGMTQRSVDGDAEDDSHIQGFVSYTQPLPVEGAKVRFGGSYAKWGDATAFGGRVRFNYDF